MSAKTHCGLTKSASLRSVLSDPASIPDTTASPSIKSPTRLPFWKRRRMVIPAAIPPLGQLSLGTVVNTPVLLSPVKNDPNDSIIFLNNPKESDLRSLFFRRSKPNSSLDRSAVSYRSSSSSIRSNSHGFSSTDSINKATPSQTRDGAVDSTSDGSVANQVERKPRRRLRAKEELCVVLPRCSSDGRTRSQKSWFLRPGFIGCEPGEGTVIVTKDTRMDAVHAEITVAGDDYLVRDAQSTGGTFLCLSTRSRHYPQRDGFRLHRGDVFRIGTSTSIRVLELGITTAITDTCSVRNDESSLSNTSGPKTVVESIVQPGKLKSADSSPPVLQRLSTEEELHLVAAYIDDECKDIVDDVLDRGVDTVAQSEELAKLEGGEPCSPIAPHRVRFADTPPVMSDGSVFLGSRYMRQEILDRNFSEPSEIEDEDDAVINHIVGRKSPFPEVCTTSCKSRRPDFIRLHVFQHDSATEAREFRLPGQKTYLIGSSPACDIRIFPSEDTEVRAVHSRITFDGTTFVLEDLSFQSNLQRQTRVLLNEHAVPVVRGDWLLFGKCALHVTTVTRAFGWDRRPDMKEAAMRLDVLRLSKRKSRARDNFFPVGFRLISTSGSGASSGNSGWGGSSGGPVMFGKGRDCDAQIFTVTLAIEQFTVQLERGTCLLTPMPTGINAGTYFLIGRDDTGLPVNDRSGGTHNPEHADDPERSADVVKYTSKPLLLAETCVFRCGGCELEVIYVKNTPITTDLKSMAAIELQEHIQLLSMMPWLQPIVYDRKLIVSLARCGHRQRLDTGDVIYEIGDSANFLFIVISGEVRLLHLSNSNDDEHDTAMNSLTHKVTAGGFFGEVSLQKPPGLWDSEFCCGSLEYTENATAATTCEILALAKEDICGYLEIYMDVVRAHLRYIRRRDKLIQTASTNVPWLRGISLQEKRLVATNAEVVSYARGSVLFEDGKLFVPTAYASVCSLESRDGFLVISCGKVRVIRHKNARQQHLTSRENDPSEGERQTFNASSADEDFEWWNPKKSVVVDSSSPSTSSTRDVSFRLEAYTRVECMFIAKEHVAHLVTGAPQQESTNDNPTRGEYADRLARGTSLANRRRHHSQVVTSGSGDDDVSGSGDDDHDMLDDSDEERNRSRWRRKKRNKQLLEQTVLETLNDAHIPNALVLYVLAGAHRGDIHVVRNVATIGGWLSGADIELNDRYVSRSHAVIEYHDNKYWLYDNHSKWGTFVRLEEEKAVDIHPGDVFLAGEVEFTCLGSFPERNKSSACCVM